ncbi:MAG: alanine racemase [Candidatus Scatovivens sp.]
MVEMKKLIVSKKDLKSNIEIINSMKKEACQIIGVVKANGMGLDLVKYSKFLIKNNIKILAVSDPEDAITLRNNKIQADILLLTPTNDEKYLEKLIKNNITVTIATIGQAKLVKKLAKKYRKKINIHLKIDTGFGRYGFLYTEYDTILKVFKMNEFISIKGVYTHFSNSNNFNYTEKQFNRFKNTIKFIKENGFSTGILHCCNSTAFIKYPNMHLDAVRLGSIIQGRTLIKIDGLKKIGQFETSIIQIKFLPIGYNIGYGNTYKTKRKSKVAVIPVGHEDGFEIRNKRDNFNFLENIKSVAIEIRKIFKNERAVAIINNKKYKIIGRIGLNYSIIDITESENININSKVILPIVPLNVNCKIRREYI